MAINTSQAYGLTDSLLGKARTDSEGSCVPFIELLINDQNKIVGCDKSITYDYSAEKYAEIVKFMGEEGGFAKCSTRLRLEENLIQF